MEKQKKYKVVLAKDALNDIKDYKKYILANNKKKERKVILWTQEVLIMQY